MNAEKWFYSGLAYRLPDPHQNFPDQSTFRVLRSHKADFFATVKRLDVLQALRRRRVKTIVAAPSASVAVPGSGTVTSMTGNPLFTPMLRLLLVEKLPVVSVAVFTLRKN